jgi:RHS repeat-associated protein
MSWLTGLDTSYYPYYGYNSASESRTWNVNGQLASIGWSGNVAPVAQIQYNYSATQNNGQITQEVDSYPYGAGVATTSYQYDPLKRLSSATAQSTGSAPAPYTQTFQYDGFGNLTQKVLNGTSTPIAVNAATNRLTNAYYDANGNMTSGAGATLTYDEVNRVTTVTETSGGEAFYGYDASNKRIYQRGSNVPAGEVFIFYGAKGEKLGQYVISTSCYPSAFCVVPETTNLWFGGRLVTTTGYSQPSPVFQDRLGTNRTAGNYPGYYNQSGLVPGWYYPYGEGVVGADSVQFATYTRDSYTGLDYADQRFYASTYGRFNTPDPYAGSAGPGDPSSWNRYSYTKGDPVNRMDRSGLLASLTCGSGGYEDDENGVEEPCEDYVPDECYIIDGVVSPECGNSFSSGFVQTQGSTNRAGDLTVNPYSNNMGGSFQEAITGMLHNIAGALASNPNCDNWLSSGSLGSAAGVINTLIQNNAYGYGDFFIGGVQTYTIAGAEGGHNVDGTSTGILGAFAINAEGAFFNSTAPGGGTLTVGAAKYAGGTPQAQAAILIHELGHVLGLLGPDYGNNGAGSKNDKTVATNCAGLINSLGKN